MNFAIRHSRGEKNAIRVCIRVPPSDNVGLISGNNYGRVVLSGGCGSRSLDGRQFVILMLLFLFFVRSNLE